MTASVLEMGAALERLTPMALGPLGDCPLVSILVSNYNYANYLPEAIESVLAQTYDNYELIIVDDGSTDESVWVINRYCTQHRRITMAAKSNGGQATGLNEAFAACKGDIICFLDADDRFAPHKLATVVAAHQAKPESGFGVHRIQRVNGYDRPKGVWPGKGRLPSGWHGERLLRDGGVLAYMPPTSALSLRRAVAERLFPLPQQNPLVSIPDQVLMRLAPLLTSIVAIDQVLADYRVHNANTYQRHGMTAESTGREIDNCRALWGAQRRFLATISPILDRCLRPLAGSRYMLQLEYIHDRLAGLPSAKVSFARFVESLRNDPTARFRWFWKSSPYMPRVLFALVLNLLMGSSYLKQILAMVRGFI